MNWISVKDRLPPPDVRVLVLLDSGLWGEFAILLGQLYVFANGKFVWLLETVSGGFSNHVTHWCELPEMPK